MQHYFLGCQFHDEEQAVQQRLAELQSQCSAASEQLRSAEQARQDAEPRLVQARREEERLQHLNADLTTIREDSTRADAEVTAGAATLTQLAERQQCAAAELAALSQQLDKSAALQPLCERLACFGSYPITDDTVSL